MKFKATVWRTGGSYVATIPKAFIEGGMLREGQEILLEVVVDE
jgi:antitoxin component of MazEF toxin-antitoxin module